MSRNLFQIEKGLQILGENGDAGVSIIKGTDLPGLLDQENNALPGSLYLRDNGLIYRKKTAGTGQDKWVRVIDQDDLTGISPRSEKIIAGTGDVAPANGGTFSLPFSDDEGTQLTDADFEVGEFVLFGIGGTPKLMEVTAKATGSLTLDDAVPALTDNDYMLVQSYLVDSPDDQEKQAMVQYVDGTIIKIADFNWNFADGIGLASGYAANSGDISSSDTVQTAIQKLDGNNDAQDSVLGTAQGAQNLGTFTGDIISDNNNVKGALSELEIDVDAIQDLTGMPAESVDLGTFTGNIIGDNQAIKPALQDLENGIEGIAAQRKVTGITTETTVDSINVDDSQAVKWLISVTLDSDPAKIKSYEFFACHNGTSSADATGTDDTVYARLRIGGFFQVSLSVDIDGAGASQVMRLRVSATNAVTVKARRVAVNF